MGEYVQLIPVGRPNRQGKLIKPNYITIHETDNTKETATAKAHANYLATTNDEKSWHFTVDENDIYQHLPLFEKGLHAGTLNGNVSSIGIELCVNKGGNFLQTLTNASKLVARLMKELSIPLNRVVQHNFWSGKDCPSTLRKNNGWDSFINTIHTQHYQLINKPDAYIDTDMGKALYDIREQLKQIPPPPWFEEEFPRASKLLNDQHGSYEFWRAVAFAIRIMKSEQEGLEITQNTDELLD